jgi:hypothetical protein
MVQNAECMVYLGTHTPSAVSHIFHLGSFLLTVTEETARTNLQYPYTLLHIVNIRECPYVHKSALHVHMSLWEIVKASRVVLDE